MPNIQQSLSLKKTYNFFNQQEQKLEDFIKSSNPIVQKNEKSSKVRRLNESFNVNPDVPREIIYFERNIKTTVVLLYIDIFAFSKIIENYTSNKIKDYLDDYYNMIIPIIYQAGGEVEKLMGDGIICVFGKPFINKSIEEIIQIAEACAIYVILKAQKINKCVKIAFHVGDITYYKVPSKDYSEYTIIGHPMTELHRLESVSVKNAVNYFTNSIYDSEYFQFGLLNEMRFEHGFSIETKNIDNLSGICYEEIKYLIIDE
ncbi:MAG: adenylate/guanylate cyclase domain-containing protein [Candidatus Azobacteroides sp.]|nr:adenylate/guanylate cyclase domain-containing protein [Candidatus Azobacteroides sp.]